MELPERYELVVKSNELIQGRHELSLTEQKIILFVISKIKSTDTEFQNYQFSIPEFCKVCGLDIGGKEYQILKDTIQALRDKSWWVKQGNSETLMSWIQKAKIMDGKGTIEIRLDEDLKPYLLQLKKNFTQYQLIHCLAFKSRYSLRLYEFICSIHFHELEPYEWTLTLEKLRKILGAETYDKWQDLKRRALEPACREINEYSNKCISYEQIKEGKKVIGIILTITEKDALDRIEIENKVNHILDHDEVDPNQLSLFEEMEGL
jgi:plasmid replication initiation protein